VKQLVLNLNSLSTLILLPLVSSAKITRLMKTKELPLMKNAKLLSYQLNILGMSFSKNSITQITLHHNKTLLKEETDEEMLSSGKNQIILILMPPLKNISKASLIRKI